MEIKLKVGLEKLLFGMKQSHVETIYGKPNKQFKDEDGNCIYLYNDEKMRLTFYAEEDFKLGYIITSNANCTLFDKKIIGEKYTDLTDYLILKNIKNFTAESVDSFENYFNETNWFTLETEFGIVTKVEIGASIDYVSDEFEWKFKG